MHPSPLNPPLSVGNSAVNHNRKPLRELFGASRPADDENENLFGLSEFAFNCFYENIAECNHFDFPYSDISDSINSNQKSVSLFHVNIRSLNKLDNFGKFYECLTTVR